MPLKTPYSKAKSIINLTKSFNHRSCMKEV